MRYIAALIGLVLAFATPALAEERILNFVSDVTVNTDASLTVRESIDVLSEGGEIRRGILRDFPTTYTDRNGIRVVVGFEVVQVRRDGNVEPYAVETISNGKRIRIGSKDVLLEFGQHRYEIIYRTTRQLGFFSNYDELYWNATGNGWTFPIDRAQAIIRLPEGAIIKQHAEYTGPQGSTESGAAVLEARGNRYNVEMPRRLEPGEGLTVAVAWQKGIVTPPTDADKWGWWISDNAGYFLLIVTLIAAGGYYFYAWNKVGRDPAKGTIIPLFKPPQGLGPAGVRYVTQYGFDDRTFAAALVGLAVKGRLKIADDDDDTYTITRLSASAGAEPLARAEKALYDTLPNGNLKLKQSNHSIVRGVKRALTAALDEEFEGQAFVRNYKWFAIGLVISIIGLIISALLMPSDVGPVGLAAIGWTTIWWGVIIGVGWGMVRGVFQQRGVLKKLSSLFGLLFLVPFVGGGVVGPVAIGFGAGSPGLIVLIGAAILLGVMNVLFFFLLRAPTLQGRKLLDEIEGFKLYMKTAEEDRLNMLNPPEKTPALFERYLPYALALDCENEWNAKFAAVLAAAAAAGASSPLWYSGSHWDSGRTSGFTDSLGSSLSSSVASASTAPGSSSGSGGGGSSGGGGGGGGGSGW